MRWRALDTAWCGLLSATSLALSVATIVRRPDLVKGADFLFSDAGHNLLIAQVLDSGGRLYQDVFSQYGPLSAYAYAWAAAWFGNTPNTYLGLFAVISAINVAIAYALVRRAVARTAAVVVTAALIVTLTVPGALAGGYTSSPFVVLERTALLLLALCWSAPTQRSVARALALGTVLGAWQGVKFGGAVVGLAAVAILDVLHLVSIRATAVDVRRWARNVAVTCAAAGAIELAWIADAFATLPAPMARDVIWPFYMLQSYGVVSAADRWPGWNGWRLMIGQYLLPLSGAALSAMGLVAWVRSNRGRSVDAGGEAAIYLPSLFYAIACLGYFHHSHHFRQFLWALVPGAAAAFAAAGMIARATIVAVWLPGVYVVAHAAIQAMPPTMVRVALPAGGDIAVSPAVRDRLSFLQQLVSRIPGEPVLYGPIASGWHVAYGVPHATRNTFFFAPEAIRPYDEEPFVHALDRTGAVVTCGGLPLREALPLPAEIRDAYARFRPWMHGADCEVYVVAGRLPLPARQ